MLYAIITAFLMSVAGEPLEQIGVHVTTGAAPGYVEDRVCANCHRDRFQSYQDVGMAQAFYLPSPEKFIEDFNAPPYEHELTGDFYEMRRRGDDIIFRRYRIADDGAPIDVFEQKVDWILGSGHHSRTYLYKTPMGELYQLPIAWYSQTHEWRMAPGYDRKDNVGVVRRVRHECMFCHNAYPDIAANDLSYWRPQTFPDDLPQGIGCQRCHGPGAKHVVAAMAGKKDEIQTTIVNPMRLDRKLRMDVCYECHFQPTVTVAGMRKPGRDVYSFRPGQALADYSVPLDLTTKEVAPKDRFEINNHPYRLEQSRCFQESEGRLNCLACHDPHRKVPVAEQSEHYRKACLSCHVAPHMKDGDCVSCHMPKRRTQDVIHVVMTDHKIQLPGNTDLLAPLKERDPTVEQVWIYGHKGAPVDALGALYQLIPILRATGGDEAMVQRFEELMSQAKPAEIEPYLDLAAAEFRLKRYPQLEHTAELILQRQPDQPLALEWKGIARAAIAGNVEIAIRALEKLIATNEPRPDEELTLAMLLSDHGRTEEAIPHYEHVLEQRPNLALAWQRLGEARRECGDRLAAIDAFRRALQIQPSLEPATTGIVATLTEMGDVETAEQYRREGEEIKHFVPGR